MVMKIICRRDGMSIIDQWQIKIRHIDLKKDTYEVLKKTVVPKLNEDLVLLGEGQKQLLLFTKEDNENGRRYCTSQMGNYEGDKNLPCFICPNTNQSLPQFIFEKGCIIKIVMMVDLTFYAAALGKINMSGNWYTWCKLG
jgi:hypothetical protein